MSGGAIESARAEAVVASPPVSRMAIALLALVGIFISTYMLLYKVGVIPAVACGSGSCETVQASSWAVFLSVPVPAWGVGGYALLFAVALAGSRPAGAGSRRIGLLLFGLGAVAFGFSMYLTAIEAFVLRAWCRWCVASAAIATLIFISSLAELRRPRSL